jgi:hypothetical protein
MKYFLYLKKTYFILYKMDRNWNRNGGGASASTGGEKIYKQPYSGGQNHHHYRKKNDFSGPEYYSKTVKSVSVQPVKKEGLQVAAIENELMDSNFSWIKNGGTQVQ